MVFAGFPETTDLRLFVDEVMPAFSETYGGATVSKIAIPPPSQSGTGPRLEERLRDAGYEVVVTPAGTTRDPWTPEDLRDIFTNVDAVVASPRVGPTRPSCLPPRPDCG